MVGDTPIGGYSRNTVTETNRTTPAGQSGAGAETKTGPHVDNF